MSTIFEDWLEEGREVGLKQGREQGLEQGREATLKLLRRYLATRFNLPLDHFDPVLRSLDLTTLTHLSDIAFEADSLADFETAMQALLNTHK